MAGTAGACFIWVASVASAADVGHMHSAGVGDAGCAIKKQWLDSLWCGSCSTWDSVGCFDTVFMEVPPCAAVCGTIAGAY